MRALALSLLTVAACAAPADPSADPTPTPADLPTPTPTAGPPLPVGMTVPDGPLFRVDTTTPVIAFEFDGVGVVGRLGPGGRRALELVEGDVVTPLTPADWVMPPAAAGSDPLLVCWNRLVGSPSALTGGELPDPRGGVVLVCRRRIGADWSPLIDIVPERPIAWLRSVTADGDGFLIDYQVDGGLLVQATADGHGHYRRRLGTTLEAEQVVQLADPETFPR